MDLSALTADYTISEGGTYVVSGSTSNYALIVDTTNASNKTVNLTLDGASIQIPSDFNGTQNTALTIKGGAMVNLTAKTGTLELLIERSSWYRRQRQQQRHFS